jgi:DNA-binding response OmpR family regulator
MMPRLPGPELVRQLRLERPGLRVLYVSGFTFGATLSDEAEFLAKPLQPAELVARVRGMLGPVAG